MTMQQTLRKWHRRFGVILALFLIIQALSGAWLAAAEIDDSPAQAKETATKPDPDSEFSEVMEALHTGGEGYAAPYRVIIGLGLTFMGVTGSMIFFKVGMKRPSAK